MTSRESFARQVRRVLAGKGEVPSPCISVCRMDAQNLQCEGCLRTLDEIAAWGTMQDAERRVVWVRIGERLAQEAA